MKACEEWYGGPLKGWGKVRHGWGRTVSTAIGEYTSLMLSGWPHVVERIRRRPWLPIRAGDKRRRLTSKLKAEPACRRRSA